MFRLFQKKQLHIYEMLAGLFVMTLIVSNIASIKVVAIGPLVFDAGTILFPLSYIVGDIVTEVYGYRKMRSLLYVGVVSLILTMTTFWVVQILPASPDWPNQVAYESILGVVWRIVLASVTALFLGEIMNAYVMARMKVRSKGKNLWVRMISSSVVGSAIDTVVFSTVAFLGTMSFGALAQLMATVFLIKITTEVIVSPLTIRIINIVKRREKIDTYEQPATYLVN
ncbi:VUT family protein [Candidatus Saccharibacteria bacterium oral taxon 955]|nr:VUT family protein [Candidatus Saccharibacteria bacterium oral taxon 955]QJU05926.1 VUT family protein [Candidatus Saccharibacteria bacterium oral taxon 955]